MRSECKVRSEVNGVRLSECVSQMADEDEANDTTLFARMAWSRGLQSGALSTRLTRWAATWPRAHWPTDVFSACAIRCPRGA